MVRDREIERRGQALISEALLVQYLAVGQSTMCLCLLLYSSTVGKHKCKHKGTKVHPMWNGTCP